MNNKRRNFATWSELLAFLAPKPGMADREVRWIWYHAPMDRSPRFVKVAKIFKNGKIRLDPMTASASPFTADSSHLGRFSAYENSLSGQ